MYVSKCREIDQEVVEMCHSKPQSGTTIKSTDHQGYKDPLSADNYV